VLDGYRAVIRDHPFVPPLSMWRAFEWAAYRGYELAVPALDVGCGDGRFFRCAFGDRRGVTGIDADPAMVTLAAASGVYDEVHRAAAAHLPFAERRFRTVFANCALEHMDAIDDVLAALRASLAADGRMICSVVTDKFLEWELLPAVAAKLAGSERAEALRRDYRAYQHVRNALSPATWRATFARAGLEVVEHVPIVPEVTSRCFLFLDHLWHVADDSPGGEVGAGLHAWLARVGGFPAGFGEVLGGLLRMESDWSIGSGAVFLLRRGSQ
jgi:SAM-dependent methyltransferase